MYTANAYKMMCVCVCVVLQLCYVGEEEERVTVIPSIFCAITKSSPIVSAFFKNQRTIQHLAKGTKYGALQHAC